MIAKYGRLLGILCLAILLANCGGGGGGGSNTSTPTTPTATVVGTVIGSGGIADVKVSAGGKSTTTDTAGNYKLSAVPVPSSKRLVVTFEKDGYATYQRSVMVEANKTYAVAANMIQYHLSESVDPKTAQNLSVSDPANPGGASLAMLDLPADAVSATGNVTVNVAVGDPTTSQGRAIFPGDYMASPNATSEPDTELESVAFSEITIKDGSKEIKTLATPADLSIKLPAEFQAGGSKAGTYVAGDPTKGTIEWWSYNETNGSWVREDADPSTPDIDNATVVDVGGVLYAQAKVTHFSWWNADHPISEHACYCVHVVDADGKPVPGVMVIAEGVTYNGRSTPAMTDANGDACVNVKRSTATSTERVKLYVEQGGARFRYIVDATEGDTATNELIVPTTQGSTLDGSGMCTQLKNNISLVYDGTITGTVTREGSGTPLQGFTVYTNFGASAVTNAAGVYTVKVPVGNNVSVFAPGLVNKTVNVPNTDPVTVDFVVPNLPPVFTSITRVPNGAVTTGTPVNITAVASDPDTSSPVEFTWSASTGSLNATTGDTVTWTAPNTASTAQITVTAKDIDNGTTVENVIIIVNDTPPPTASLKVTVKDNPISNTPVAGATVVFYNTDNRTIDSSAASNGVITTDATGVADFGNVGRSTGTITIISQGPSINTGTGTIQSNIDSFVDVPMGSFVYYVDSVPLFGTYCTGAGVDTPINVNFTNAPDPTVATDIELQPMGNTFPNDANTNATSICSELIQNDGTISLLGFSYISDPLTFDFLFQSYGYVSDQVLDSVNPYTISMNHNFLTYGYTTSPPTPMAVSYSGYRKGVSFSFYPISTVAPSQSAGNVLVPTEFPVDRYEIYAYDFGVSNANVDKLVWKPVTTLAQTESIPVNDTSFTALSYDVPSNVISWTKTGTSPVDDFSLYLSNDTAKIYWSVFLPNSANSWQVMQLPAGLSFGTDTTDLNNTFCTYDVESDDVGNLVGHAQIWNLLINGTDIGASIDQLNTNVYYSNLTGTPCAVTAVVPAAAALNSASSGQTQSGKRTNGSLLRSLSRLSRR